MHTDRRNKVDFSKWGCYSEIGDAKGLGSAGTQNVNLQFELVVRKANTMFESTSRGLEYKSRDVMLRLYKAVVRLHLGYCERIWTPNLWRNFVIG